MRQHSGNQPDSRVETQEMAQNYITDPEPFINAVKEDRGDISAGEIALAISTDHTFRIPAIRMAEARANHGGDTWMYEFDWKKQSVQGALGACHALEIPFTFGTLGVNGTDVFLGTSELPHGLEDLMHKSWAAFIATGNPTTQRLPEWPTYSPTSRTVMRFADHTDLTHDPWPSVEIVGRNSIGQMVQLTPPSASRSAVEKFIELYFSHLTDPPFIGSPTMRGGQIAQILA